MAPGKRMLPPAAFAPATRPCLFAAPASGLRTFCPVTRLTHSTMSPAAKMSGTEVRIPASTQTPPLLPSRQPAFSAISVLPFTPAAMMTRSASSARPSERTTPSARPSPVISATPTPVRTLTPQRSSSPIRTSENSGSMLLMSWGSFSTSVTSSPRARRFSALSSPMKPPPITTALRMPSVSRAMIRSASGTVKTV